MRPVFCGNFDLDTRQYDLERLFSKYGPISRIDVKSGIGSSTILHYFSLLYCGARVQCPP
jgi:RNA recognition motif-containing protein